MKTQASLYLSWIFAAVCTLGFFMPWARFTPGSGIQDPLAVANSMLSGEDDFASSYVWMRKSEVSALLRQPGDGLSAYQIILLSDEDTLSSEVARAWLLMLWGEKDAEAAGMKVKIIILIPVLALVGAVMLGLVKPRQRWLLALALAQIGTYAFLRWKLNLSYAERLLWQIELSWGLWLSLFALMGAALVTGVRALLPPKVRF